MLCKTDSIKCLFFHVTLNLLCLVNDFVHFLSSFPESLPELSYHNLRPSTIKIKITRRAIPPRIQYMTLPPFFWCPWASTIFSWAFSALSRAVDAFLFMSSRSPLYSCTLTLIYFAILFTSFIRISTLSRSSWRYLITSDM